VFCPERWQQEFGFGKEEGPPERASLHSGLRDREAEPIL
jgi:hypothetical protein